jgi:hypothetical protein
MQLQTKFVDIYSFASHESFLQSQIKSGLSLTDLIDQLNSALSHLLFTSFATCLIGSVLCFYVSSFIALYNERPTSATVS